MNHLRQMDRTAYLWLRKTALKNLWRVSTWCELDDLIQDGAMIYYHVLHRYPHAVDPPHIMRLFQVSYINHLHTLSKVTTRSKQTATALATFVRDEAEPDAFNLALLIERAPEYIRAVLKLYTTEHGRRRLRSLLRVKHNGERETTNERLCRLIGITDQQPQPDIVGMMKLYFGVV
jgi:hypothetical protein